jgi:hypothetical protein
MLFSKNSEPLHTSQLKFFIGAVWRQCAARALARLHHRG